MIQDLTSGRLIGLFLVGLVLFNYPILSLFNRDLTLMGIPILYVYIFTAWCVVIGLIILITNTQKTARPGELEDDRD